MQLKIPSNCYQVKFKILKQIFYPKTASKRKKDTVTGHSVHKLDTIRKLSHPKYG